MKMLRRCSFDQKDIADDFYGAYKRCIMTDRDNRHYLIPAYTNGLFACELYLKYLLGDKVTKIKKSKRHNLKILFDNLDEKYKNELFMIICDIRYNLNQLLDDIGDGYNNWRYIFEDGNDNFGSGRPIEYSDYFLKTYLPKLEEMTAEYKDNNLNKYMG